MRLEPNGSPAQSDSLLPNEMKQGWGQVPRGHWIIAHSQVNSHDENTAVNVYYQMPFSTAQNKALLLQQVCPHACIRQAVRLSHSLVQTAELAVFSAIASQKCFETLRTVRVALQCLQVFFSVRDLLVCRCSSWATSRLAVQGAFCPRWDSSPWFRCAPSFPAVRAMECAR